MSARTFGLVAAKGCTDCNTAWMPDDRSLERLALSEWSSSASARVVSITVAGDRAEVALLVDGDYEYWLYFQRGQEGWRETVSSNGRTIGWDDPSVIQW